MFAYPCYSCQSSSPGITRPPPYHSVCFVSFTNTNIHPTTCPLILCVKTNQCLHPSPADRPANLGLTQHCSNKHECGIEPRLTARGLIFHHRLLGEEKVETYNSNSQLLLRYWLPFLSHVFLFWNLQHFLWRLQSPQWDLSPLETWFFSAWDRQTILTQPHKYLHIPSICQTVFVLNQVNLRPSTVKVQPMSTRWPCSSCMHTEEKKKSSN